jgi:hypothetical protein
METHADLCPIFIEERPQHPFKQTLLCKNFKGKSVISKKRQQYPEDSLTSRM